MAIQIKAINVDLLMYKNQLQKKVAFSNRMVEKAHNAMDKISELSMSNGPVEKAKELMYGLKTFGYAMTAFAALALETRDKKKALREYIGCREDEIAMDVNDFEALASQLKRAKCYGNDLRYDCSVRREWLEDIHTIFGDANLQALRDFSCLSSLTSIYGNLNLAQCEDSKVDLSGLQIQMVYGDIHAEKAISTKGLEDLIAVGGTIYYQDKAYTLDQFQQLFGQDTKERQR